MKCGLLGRKLGHSYSPMIHSQLGNYSYVLYEKEPEALEGFLKSGDFRGLNVTIPYKKEVISWLDELTPTASKLGAVNTIVRRNDGTLLGHNTDYFGFRSMILHSRISPSGKKVLVLGSGGASSTAVAVLKEMGAYVVVISRTGENNYENLHRHYDAEIIVNTTPVGMYPHTGASPLSLVPFKKLCGVLDVVYNPARTQLLLDAQELQIPCTNGLWMLVAQAKESSEYFQGIPIPDEKIIPIYLQLKSQMENIVLIGMPGCGKTAIAKSLGALTGREVVDCDDLVQKAAGMTIPDIFSMQGEDCFRQYETQALRETGHHSNLIISTGGGCVTQNRNYPLLHQNGTIFWIQRDLNELPTDGRPLSQSNSLSQMFIVREPMYRRFSDHEIQNLTTPEEAARKIVHILEESL